MGNETSGRARVATWYEQDGHGMLENDRKVQILPLKCRISAGLHVSNDTV